MNNFSLLIKFKEYKNFWISNFTSNLAIWILVVGSGIYMSEQTNSPMLIALVQIMSSLPIFIFSIPFGAVADLMNIYKLLSIVQIGMGLTAFAYTLASVNNFFMPEAIIIFTGIIGIATAIRLPSGQAAISQTIPHQDIKTAAIMNNFGFSLAKAIGPFIAGFLFFYYQSYIVFAFATLLFFSSSIFLVSKARKIKVKNKQNKSYLPELRRGFGYLLTNSYIQYISLSSFVFFFFSTSLWASMPYLAKYVLDVNSKTQGAMAGFIGLGSILTGIFFPKIRFKFANKRILLCLFIGSGASLYSFLIFEANLYFLFFCLSIFGFSWACAVSFFNGEIQSECPKEMRSRLISIYFFVMYGGLTLGNYITGKLLLFYPIKYIFQFFGISLIIFGCVIFAFFNFAVKKQAFREKRIVL